MVDGWVECVCECDPEERTSWSSHDDAHVLCSCAPTQAAELRAMTSVVPRAVESGRRKLLLDRPQWEDDDATTKCRGCGDAFGLTRRKHHCRSCGSLCCGRCSTSQMRLPYFAYFDEQRVCDDCAQFVPTLSRAACVVLRDAGRVGLDKTPSAQVAQLEAIDDIVRMLEGAEDTLLMAQCGVVDLLIMLATLPLEQVSRCR
jgi:hypothetical protein